VFEIGNSLREARLRQQLDFAELEQATKIRGKYLRALEEERFDVLPAQTYVKGFLRTYAEYLGLDGHLYVDEYNSRYVTGEDEPTPRTRRTTYSRPSRRFETSAVLLALSLIGILTLVVIAAWRYGGADADESAIPNLTPTQPAAKQPAAQKPVVRKKQQPARARLVVTAASGDCWLEVHIGSGTGRLVYQGTLEQGQTQVFTARALWVIAGAPANLGMMLNGKRVAVPGTSSPLVMIATARGVRRAATA
jgi:cytoskeleton protein RodZ